MQRFSASRTIGREVVTDFSSYRIPKLAHFATPMQIVRDLCAPSAISTPSVTMAKSHATMVQPCGGLSFTNLDIDGPSLLEVSGLTPGRHPTWDSDPMARMGRKRTLGPLRDGEKLLWSEPGVHGRARCCLDKPRTIRPNLG